MVMPGHVCPWGLKSRGLLQRRGYEVEDHLLTSRAETDAFMERHGVETTPQTWIGDERVGGYSELAERLDHREAALGGAYQPVLAIFAVAALLALAMVWGYPEALERPAGWLGLFIAFGMTLLGIQKLQDVESFQTMFVGYDLLSMRDPRYAYVYPFLETLAGVLMVGHLAPWLSAPIALVIGIEGAVSVAKAVWIDKRELKCACVGGDSEVPLGFVSFTESAMMAVMGLWTLIWLAG
nr:MauE/DoxX family redox-associated membrane protein [Wenxinia marina]